jgi:inhibitor of cysteine peptidase
MTSTIDASTPTPSRQFSASNDTSAQHLSIEPLQDKYAVELKKGKTLSVSMPSNPTTGYSWSLTNASEVNQESSVLQQTGEGASAFVIDNNGQVGAGGTETFDFDATAAGYQTLRFVYARPWEKGAGEQREVTVDVRVV